MKLINARIKNIRSISEANISDIFASSNKRILAGQNESGKTAILKALNYFGNGPTTEFKQYDAVVGKNPYVSCGFRFDDDINDFGEKFTSLVSGIQPSKLKDFFINKTIYMYRGSEEGDPEIEECVDEWYFLSRNSFDEIYQFIIHENGNFEAFDKEWLEQADLNEDDLNFAGDSPWVSLSPLTPDVIKDKVYKEIDILISSFVPDFEYFNSFDNLLPENVLLKDIDKHKAIKDFSMVYDFDFNKLVGKSDREIATKIKELNNKFTNHFRKVWTQSDQDSDPYLFEVSFTHNSSGDPIVKFDIIQNQTVPLSFHHKSTGFKWFSAFDLKLQAIAKKAKSHTILLIDEPGQGLHEKAQQDVVRHLNKLCGSANMSIMYSTHNPCLILNKDDEIDFGLLSLVTRDKINGTVVKTVNQLNGTESSIDVLLPVQRAMGVHNIASLVDLEKCIVICEGISDHYYFTAFKKILGVRNNIVFVPSTGAGNIIKYLNLLLGFGYKVGVLFDGDRKGKEEAEKVKKSNILVGYEKRIHVLEVDCVEQLFVESDKIKIQNLDCESDKKLKAITSLGFYRKTWLKSEFEDKTLTNFKNIFDVLKKMFKD